MLYPPRLPNRFDRLPMIGESTDGGAHCGVATKWLPNALGSCVLVLVRLALAVFISP